MDKIRHRCFHREDEQKHNKGREEAIMYGANNVDRKQNICPITPSQTAIWHLNLSEFVFHLSSERQQLCTSLLFLYTVYGKGFIQSYFCVDRPMILPYRPAEPTWSSCTLLVKGPESLVIANQSLKLSTSWLAFHWTSQMRVLWLDKKRWEAQRPNSTDPLAITGKASMAEGEKKNKLVAELSVT